MNKYETIMILNNEISEEERKNIISKIESYISKNGKIVERQDLGIKKLAYEVRKHNKGYYYLIRFKANATYIAELERIYRITDEVLKFIVIREN